MTFAYATHVDCRVWAMKNNYSMVEGVAKCNAKFNKFSNLDKINDEQRLLEKTQRQTYSKCFVRYNEEVTAVYEGENACLFEKGGRLYRMDHFRQVFDSSSLSCISGYHQEGPLCVEGTDINQDHNRSKTIVTTVSLIAVTAISILAYYLVHRYYMVKRDSR